MKVNWEKIKNEYITDSSTSYEKLAVKYGITKTAISNRAKKEKWVEERERNLTETCTKIQEAVIEDNIEFYKDLQKDIKEATKIIVNKTIATANSLDQDEQFVEKRLNTCQKTIESAINTIEKICFPQHETTDNNITVILGSAEEYSE